MNISTKPFLLNSILTLTLTLNSSSYLSKFYIEIKIKQTGFHLQHCATHTHTAYLLGYSILQLCSVTGNLFLNHKNNRCIGALCLHMPINV